MLRPSRQLMIPHKGVSVWATPNIRLQAVNILTVVGIKSYYKRPRDEQEVPKRIPCHRLILAATSDDFDNTFPREWMNEWILFQQKYNLLLCPFVIFSRWSAHRRRKSVQNKGDPTTKVPRRVKDEQDSTLSTQKEIQLLNVHRDEEEKKCPK